MCLFLQLALGLYAVFLEVWLEHIPAERFCVVALEHFAAPPAVSTADVAEMHGRRALSVPELEIESNLYQDKKAAANAAAKATTREMSYIERCLGLPPLTRDHGRHPYELEEENINRRGTTALPMLAESRRMLERFYSPYNERLARLPIMGHVLAVGPPQWLVAPA